MNTESCPCPVCNSNRCTVVYSDLSDLLQGLPGIFNLVKCRECNQLFLNPRPTVESIKFYYPSNYESFINYSIDNLGLIKKISIKYGLHKRCRLVSTYQSHGRLLDVGCGTGQFLDAMRKRPGWSVVGIDISPVAIRVAREELKLDVHLGTSRVSPSQRPVSTWLRCGTCWNIYTTRFVPWSSLAAYSSPMVC